VLLKVSLPQICVERASQNRSVIRPNQPNQPFSLVCRSLNGYSATRLTMAGVVHGEIGSCPPSSRDDPADIHDIPATYKRVTLDPQETLLEALVLGSKTLLKRAIKMRADLNAKLETEYKTFPRNVLSIATKLGHLGVVQELIKAGASVAADARTTPLLEASAAGHLHIVKYLVELGVDVNECATHDGGDTAVESAGDERHFEIVEYLLAHGATKHVNDPETLSPDPAAHRRISALVSALLRGSIPSAVAMYKAGARVVPDSSEDIAEYLLERHQSYFCAPRVLYYYAIAALMRAGADIHPKKKKKNKTVDSEPGTGKIEDAQLWATMSVLGHTPASELRWDIHETTPAGKRRRGAHGGQSRGCPSDQDIECAHLAFQVAVLSNDVATVRMALEAGYPIDAPFPRDVTSNGWSSNSSSSIGAACYYGARDVVSLLLEYGALDPVRLAALPKSKWSTRTPETLAEYVNTTRIALLRHSSGGYHIQLTSMLLAALCPTLTGAETATLLCSGMEKAIGGETVKLFIAHGWTPAMHVEQMPGNSIVGRYADRSGGAGALLAVLRAGADVNRVGTTDDGSTPLMRALSCARSVYPSLLLMCYGADVNAIWEWEASGTPYYDTCLELCLDNDNRVCDLLLPRMLAMHACVVNPKTHVSALEKAESAIIAGGCAWSSCCSMALLMKGMRPPW
jgi:hypothetical protein